MGIEKFLNKLRKIPADSVLWNQENEHQENLLHQFGDIIEFCV
jgi:hypothetical protein